VPNSLLGAVTAERSGSANRGGESPPPPSPHSDLCAHDPQKSAADERAGEPGPHPTPSFVQIPRGVLLDPRLWEAVTGRCDPLYGGASTPSEVGVPAGW
jgi:hypothetical protein